MERTKVASRKTATARPNPICWNITSSPLAKSDKYGNHDSSRSRNGRPVERIP